MSEEIQESGPVILHQGKYRLYEKPDGTLRIQYRRDDKDEDDFIEVPGELIKLGQQADAGTINPMQMLRMGMKLIGGGLPFG